jgi:hypothetical protein
MLDPNSGFRQVHQPRLFVDVILTKEKEARGERGNPWVVGHNPTELVLLLQRRRRIFWILHRLSLWEGWYIPVAWQLLVSGQ